MLLKRTATVALAATVSLIAAGCSTSTDTEASPTDLAIGSTDLSGVCPSTLVVQTPWDPEADYAFLYEMLGDDVDIDTDMKKVTGPLMADGEYTGINLEIRAGGAAVGFQGVGAIMTSDPDVDLGLVDADSSIMNWESNPTTAVYATYQKNPAMFMWDPETYPDVKNISDLIKTGAVIRSYAGTVYADYLVYTGELPESQLDTGYDGTPASFVAADGKDAQYGLASSEPYLYENEIESWKKPVAYSLFSDNGWENYNAMLSVRTSDLDGMSECLSGLVPIVQQAEANYLDDPARTNKLIVDLVEKYDTGWTYSAAAADAAVEILRGLAVTDDVTTIGKIEPEQFTTLRDKMADLMTSQGQTPPDESYIPSLYATNFVDDSITLK